MTQTPHIRELEAIETEVATCERNQQRWSSKCDPDALQATMRYCKLEAFTTGSLPVEHLPSARDLLTFI